MRDLRKVGMDEVSSTEHGPSRPSKGFVWERFNAMKKTAIDCGMGHGDSWAKKVGANDSGVRLEEIQLLLDVLGLKVVDKSKVCIDRGVLQSYFTISAAALNAPEKLRWDE